MSEETDIFDMVARELWPRVMPSRYEITSDVLRKYQEAVDEILTRPRLEFEQELLDYALDLMRADNLRHESIFGRAGLLFRAAGIVSALFAGIGAAIATSGSPALAPSGALTGGVAELSITQLIMLVTCAVALVYLAKTVMTILAIHGENIRYVLGPDDLAGIDGRTKYKFRRHVTMRVLSYVLENYKSTALQMERLVTAQKAFRNAILAVIGGGLLLVILRLGAG